MIRAIKEDACSVFNTGGTPGMLGFVGNSYLAGAAGMPVWHGSGNDCGIVDASYLHSCAAAPNCTLPSDILSFLREDDLIVEPIPIRDSYATVSDRPGLGVDLDKEAVRRYQVKS
jgi:L-alanine-DL-glutamate epimerase-like enolase superfamily enzyme